MEKKAVSASPAPAAGADDCAAADAEVDGCIGCILPSILGESGPASLLLFSFPRQDIPRRNCTVRKDDASVRALLVLVLHACVPVSVP